MRKSTKFYLKVYLFDIFHISADWNFHSNADLDEMAFRVFWTSN